MRQNLFGYLAHVRFAPPAVHVIRANPEENLVTQKPLGGSPAVTLQPSAQARTCAE